MSQIQPTTRARTAVLYTNGSTRDDADAVKKGIMLSWKFAVGFPLGFDTPQEAVTFAEEAGTVHDRLFKVTVEEVGTTE